MGLDRCYKFCPYGCGKSVKYLVGANEYNQFGYYKCDRCGSTWGGRPELYRAQVQVGLRSHLPYSIKKKNFEGDLV